MKAKWMCLAVLASFLLAAPAAAGLINLLPGRPDIYSGGIQVDYDAGDQSLTAEGTAFTITMADDSVYPISGGEFDLIAEVGPGGTLAGGTLQINGTISALGATSGTLLLATLDDFGFMDPPGGTLFEFTFSVTGGDLAALVGAGGGIILDAWDWDTAFNGAFNQDFSNYGLGGTDAFAPEPATLALMAGGLLLFVRRRFA